MERKMQKKDAIIREVEKHIEAYFEPIDSEWQTEKVKLFNNLKIRNYHKTQHIQILLSKI